MLFLNTLCDDLSPIIRFLKFGIFPIIQWGIPILLILFGSIDLGKAVVAGKEDEMKNAQKMLLKRFLYAVLVFFVIPLVSLVFNIFGNAGLDEDDLDAEPSSWSECWYDIEKDGRKSDNKKEDKDNKTEKEQNNGNN